MKRHHLPNRRELETFSFEHEGVSYQASIGRFEDGTIGEVFLNAGKIGSAAHITARESAVTMSIALQCGVPLGILFSALPQLKNGDPAGPLGAALKFAGTAR